MFKPTYLYVKTHNITGLKYFGKTISSDPFKYRGSGTRWLNHIKYHGYDVTTVILGYYDNEEECKRIALQFGIDNDIVKSNEWANLKEETINGGFDHINTNYELKLQITQKASQAIIEKYKDDKIRIAHSKNISNIMKQLYPKGTGTFKGRAHSDKTKRTIGEKNSKSQSGGGNSQYGTIWVTDGVVNKKIKKNDIISDGWYKGRICK